ncbi:Pentatricopeptide repeat [Macleaya cordata]|uniref:Pentatricopeptide repeat n=1 Tax=Macleaya cordata TaxID=56857 RepID=A0A200R0T1_MACCD|nr:Pentatricopeptide repeat [Macleaya cordata]
MKPMLAKIPFHHPCRLFSCNKINNSLLRPLTTSLSLSLDPPDPSPSPFTTSTHHDHKTHCFSLADRLLNRGLISAAQGVIDRIIHHSPSISDVISTVHFAIDRNLDLNSHSYAFFIQKLVNSGHSHFAEKLYTDTIISRGDLDEALCVFDLMIVSGTRPTAHLYLSLVHNFLKRRRIVEAESLCKKMESYHLSPGRVIYTEIIYGHCKEGDMERAVDVFGRMQKMGCEPDAYTYNTLIYGFCELGSVDLGWELYYLMLDSGLQPNVVTYSILISKYCKDGKVDCGLKLLEEMFSSNVAPTVHCYSALLSALYKENRVDMADDLLNKMLDSGVAPDHLIYLYLIKRYPKDELRLAEMILQALVKSGCGNDASLISSFFTCLLNKAVEEDVEPLVNKILGTNICFSDEVFSILISALCAGGETNLALKFVYKIRFHRCKPLLSMYNFMIKYLCREGSFEDAKSLIGCMEGQGMLPNLATYLIMVNEHCKRGDLFSAFEVFEEMNERGLKPSVAIYDSIIGALCNDERLVEAEHMFKRMLKAGVAADEVVYTTLINGYSKNGKPIEACRLFHKMIKSGIKPSSHAYAALINGLIKKNMTNKGYNYLSRMLESGFVPDIVLYTMLINQFCRKGDFSFALNILDLMVRNKIHPDLITYGSLISGFCRNDLDIARRCHFVDKKVKYKLLLLLHQFTSKPMRHSEGVPWRSFGEMIDYVLMLMQDAKENGLMPDLHLHNAVINGYCRAGKMRDAYAHFQLMQEDGLGPNQVTYTTFIDGYIRHGEIDRAIQLFNSMNLDGCAPDKVTYNILIKGLCRTRRIIEALSLSHTMKKRGLYPSKVSNERLLKSLCDMCSRDLAFQIHEEMLLHGYVPCRCNYRLQSLCEICLSSFALKRESHTLIDMMLKRGKSADEAIKSLMNVLITWCQASCKLGLTGYLGRMCICLSILPNIAMCAADNYRASPMDDMHKSFPGEDLLLQIWCPSDKFDRAMGQNDGIIEMLRGDIGVDVRGLDEVLFPAQEALLHIESQIVDLGSDKDNNIRMSPTKGRFPLGTEGEDKLVQSPTVVYGSVSYDWAIIVLYVVDPGSCTCAMCIALMIPVLVEITSRLRSYLYWEIFFPEDFTPPSVSAPGYSGSTSVLEDAVASAGGSIDNKENDSHEDTPSGLNRSKLEVVIPDHAVTKLIMRNKLAQISKGTYLTITLHVDLICVQKSTCY